MNSISVIVCLALSCFTGPLPEAHGGNHFPEETFGIPFQTSDGKPQQMFVRFLAPSDENHPPVVILHFASGHSGRMVPLARALAARGYPAYAIDLLGHGQSSKGEPVFEDTMLGLDQLIEILREKHAASRVGLVGSSMGGEIAVMYALRQASSDEETSVGSIVAQGLHAPWQRDVAWRFTLPTFFLQFTDPIPPIFVSPPIVLSNWMFPPRRIYGSRELRQDFRNDPLRKRAYPGRVVVKAARYRLDLPDHPIDTPLLVLHGTKDRVVRLRYANRVADGLSRYFNHLTMMQIEKASHAIFEENTMLAAELLDDWFRRTLP